MNLSDAIAWALVELESRQPQYQAIKQVLEHAQIEAARLSISHHVGQTNLLRLARAVGGPSYD